MSGTFNLELHGTRKATRVVAVLAVTLIAAQSCKAEPSRVSLATLVAEQEKYEGRTVETSGVVKRFGDEPANLHYWLEDDRSNRVGLEPPEAAARWLDREVVVVGKFEFHEARGRFLAVQRVRPSSRR